MPKAVWGGKRRKSIRGGIEYNKLAHRRAAFTDVARFCAFTDYNY